MEPNYTITLNKEQAQTLMIILERVSGHPDTSSRKYAGEIFYKLYQDMIDARLMCEVRDFEHAHGDIYFEDVLKGQNDE